MPLFDSYITVDWSVANTPNTGRDSIWFTELSWDKRGRLARRCLNNPATRAEATQLLGDRLAKRVDEGKRVLVGFDFPFGYPRGTAGRLGHDGLQWQQMWSEISDLIDDRPDNRNNRFNVAEGLNDRLYGEAFPFWGHTGQDERAGLKKRGRRPHGPDDLSERRLVEIRIRKTQPVWKLAYTGSVGSQALTGIPRVRALRHDPRLASSTRIWPFETGLRHDPKAQVILAEAYPSLVEPDILDGKPKDAGQVTALARHYARLDEGDALEPLFAADPDLNESEMTMVTMEEAWILGVTGGTA
ncbi:hypothetical protein [Aestuariispira ectoiniformans]|uniref:hypothetical protein n=1 Tax=Aestuariispira ectoiniformans TaxID=2775080 RepID=UPI00223B9F9D|nr:hypothetical protein [Aestuariispira ectoiniformans]